MNTLTILHRIDCGDFQLKTEHYTANSATKMSFGKHSGILLYVGKAVPDNETGEDDGVQWGRPWAIPDGWSEAKIVATALTACKFWLEHELREQFSVVSEYVPTERPFYPNH